ncbi:MAG TPA: adenylosuccinate lyase [Steroidobacteraceae bacterium]|nr:adenylosuccinate lyase [Steroidobacteraceae bacterium]
MSNRPIDALSPLDGRYATKLATLREIFSEAGLMRERVRVECAWLLALAGGPARMALADLPPGCGEWLAALAHDPIATDVAAIKQIESRTNHDVKAVELWLRDGMAARGATPAQLEWVHFGCTSEDVNNLAYASMLKAARSRVLLPMLEEIGATLDALAERHAATGMLGRTHGQAATPTTVGKEFANFAARLQEQRDGIARIRILGKMNGAVGNFNAHIAALPAVDWPALSAAFIGSLALEANEYTTQIEPHDWIAEYAHAVIRADTVLLALARDMWSYISIGYFRQRVVAGEVGSSTMPHKVNPIDFENAEGNLGIANALLGHFAEKLPVSRWQRDLTDSTVLRNFGVALGHAALAYAALRAGLGKLELDEARVREDLDGAWEVLAEAIQTVMRANGLPDAYDRLKAFTRGRAVDRTAMREFVASLELPAAEKERLLRMEPASYLGLAPTLARRRR